MRKPKKSDIAKFLRFAEALLLEIGFEPTSESDYHKVFKLDSCEATIWKENETRYAVCFVFEKPNHLTGRSGKHNFSEYDPELAFSVKSFAFFVRRMWLEKVIEPKSEDLLLAIPYWGEWAKLANMRAGVFGEVVSSAKSRVGEFYEHLKSKKDEEEG